MNHKNKFCLAAAVIAASFSLNASAALLITEVDAAGSGNTYNADWFELTNTGPSAVILTGWRIDDSVSSFANSVALRGVTSIAAGQSIVFLEANASATNDETIKTNFINAWFGGTAPSWLVLGTYGGSGVSFSTTAGDAVTLYNSTGTIMAGVTFGATPAGATLDNAAGVNGAAISTPSAVGVNGAFAAAGEIGSPGVVPVPAAVWLLGSGLGFLGAFRRRKAA